MKKGAYLLIGIIVGAIIATSGNAFAAQVKSLIGQKVTGEVIVTVNGKALSTKGAIVNNTTNVPARAITDAIGGTISLSGNTVSITTPIQTNTSSDNPYTGQTKTQLEAKIKGINDAITNDQNSINQYTKLLNEAQDASNSNNPIYSPEAVENYKSIISQAQDDLAYWQGRLTLAQEALAALN